MKHCSSCKLSKELTEFFKNKSRKDGHHHACKPCSMGKSKDFIKAASRRYYEKNKEKIKLRDLNYRSKNKEKIANRNYKYQKDRAAKDPAYRAIRNARIRIGNFLRNKDKYSKSLGCSFETFKYHIESQFQPGMSWDNYGKWHIDHIYPLKVAHDMGPDRFSKACLYTNLQPLWAADNLKKSSAVTPQSLLKSNEVIS